MKKLRVATGYKIDGGVRLPTYKTIPVEEEFIKFYRIMEHMVTKLTRPELLLSLFLSRKGGETGIVYNNKKVRDEFLEYIDTKSMKKLTYKTQTIHQAFSTLKKAGVLISHDDIEGAYWINPSFLFDGKDTVRDKIVIEIDRQEFGKDMKTQKNDYEGIRS